MIPLPTNLLPYWFFPWNTKGWWNYTPFVSHKELLAVDAIRQIFVWKFFAFQEILKGIIPLWNPYNFAGQPLIANFQSSVFYPLSWFFLFLNPVNAWSVYIYLQPLMAFIFMFLFLRRKTGTLPAVFSGLALVFSGYFSTRYFWGVYIHSLLWLPLILLLLDKFKEGKINKWLFIPLSAAVYSLSILGGYPQHAVFVLILSGSYGIFLFGKTLKNYLPWALGLLLAFLICSVQLMPTAELYRNSMRDSSVSDAVFNKEILDYKYLITLLSPDYWGNPATNNYFGGIDYSGSNAYAGLLALIFALSALNDLKRSRELKFWLGVSVYGLIMAFRTPFSYIPVILHIPVLDSGAPWNNLFFLETGIVVLAAYGLKSFWKNKKPAVNAACVILVMEVLLQTAGRGNPIIFRNQLLFTGIALSGLVIMLMPVKLAIAGIFAVQIFAGSMYLWKVSPFGEIKYFYPDHPVISFLKKNAGINRFWGYGGAHFASNFATYFGIYHPEGYDSLWPRWYGELVAGASTNGKPDYIDRADVSITEKDSPGRRRFLNIIGVKYFLDKSDSPDGDGGPNLAKYPPDRFKLLKQWGQISVYENLETLPRAAMFGDYLVTGGNNVPEKFYDPKTDPTRTLILEKPISRADLSTGSAVVKQYLPDLVDIETESSSQSLLFLSDSYYPGWLATVNGNETEIFKADYAFRAVLVPAGTNRVIFKYQPASFALGEKMTFAGLIIFSCTFLIGLRKRNGWV